MLYTCKQWKRLGLWNLKDAMNREGKPSLIIFINLGGMKSLNEKDNL